MVKANRTQYDKIIQQRKELENELTKLKNTKTHLERFIVCQPLKQAKKNLKTIDSINKKIKEINQKLNTDLNQSNPFEPGYARQASNSCQPSSSADDENTSLLTTQTINSINNSQQANEENKCCPSSCTIL